LRRIHPVAALALAAAVLCAERASAQVRLDSAIHYESPPSSRIREDEIIRQQPSSAGSEAVHWTFDDGFGQQTIYVRNTSAHRAMRIVRWRVFNCDNVRRRVCRKHEPGPTIPPGRTVRLATVTREMEERGYSFRYELTPEWVEAGPAAPAAPQPAD
jgi:hypothetical protein